MSAYAPAADQQGSPQLVRNVDAEHLSAVPAFASLPGELLMRLVSLSARSYAVPGQELCREGDSADSLVVLLDGQVALFGAAANGCRAVVEVVRPVSFILLSTVLARLSYPMSAEALSPATVLAIDADGLHALMAESPELARALVHAQAAEFGAMVRQVCDLKLRTAAERLATYLLSLSQEQRDGSAQFRLPVRKRLLAAQLGCGQENLSRAFATLREFGVETHGARIILHDIPRLRDFAANGSAAQPEYQD